MIKLLRKMVREGTKTPIRRDVKGTQRRTVSTATKTSYKPAGQTPRPINQTSKSNYRSDGEKLIAEFLSAERIHFVHEYPVALRDEQNQIRIWYPDFFLPRLNIIIEYLGMKGKQDYEKAVRRKTKLFKELKVDFIYITPNRFTKPDWKHYIIRRILEIMESKDSEYYKMRSLAKKYKYKPGSSVGDDWGLG